MQVLDDVSVVLKSTSTTGVLLGPAPGGAVAVVGQCKSRILPTVTAHFTYVSEHLGAKLDVFGNVVNVVVNPSESYLGFKKENPANSRGIDYAKMLTCQLDIEFSGAKIPKIYTESNPIQT